MKKILLSALFITITFIFPTKVSAACGTWNGVGSTGSCSVPGGLQCLNNLTICCEDRSQCPSSTSTPTPTPTPTNTPASTPISTPANTILCSPNNLGSTLTPVRCELADGTLEWCSSPEDCTERQAEITGGPNCTQIEFSQSCPSPYTVCSNNASYCCVDTNDCNSFDPNAPPLSGSSNVEYDICRGVKESDKSACDACSSGGTGVWTGLGCLPTEPEDFVVALLRLSIGIGSGVAFLRLIAGAFQITVASGNPESVQAGRDTITSSIAGLLFIIFSAIILNLIGVQIFNIPGF